MELKEKKDWNIFKMVAISTTIPMNKYIEIKEGGFKLNELLLLGLDTKKNSPNLIKRLDEMREDNLRLVRDNQKMSNKIAQIELKMSKNEVDFNEMGNF